VDDIRAITVRRDAPLPMYGPPGTLENLAKRFPYIFDENIRPAAGTSKPEGHARPLAGDETVTIGDVDVIAVPVPHGKMTVYAYRIGPLAYVTDAKTIPPAALDKLRGAQVLVINALFRTEHPTHLSIPEAVRAAREIGAERTYLTHLTHDNFHADLEAELPRGVTPAFDGLTIRIDET
jgi:phosphoribosyl 1,2-cyclic phosphate phosphodiesterase